MAVYAATIAMQNEHLPTARDQKSWAISADPNKKVQLFATVIFLRDFVRPKNSARHSGIQLELFCDYAFQMSKVKSI